jgi:hypothetical protein
MNRLVTATLRHPPAWLLFTLAIISRAAAGVGAIVFPVLNETGSRISPLHEPTGGDYLVYKTFAPENFGLLAAPFESLFQHGGLKNWLEIGFVPGPLFPWLIYTLEYASNPLPLACIFLFLGALSVYGWAREYQHAGLSALWQYVLMALPLLIYYSLFVSTDLLLAVVVLVVYHLLRSGEVHPEAYSLALLALLGGLLVRPNALALVPVLAWALFRAPSWQISKAWAWITLLLMASFFSYYYAPYFLAYRTGSDVITYWGYGEADYVSGLFQDLPDWLNRPLSIAALFVSKLLYASGLRPSYSDVPPLYVVLRAVTSLWILPGIVHSLLKGGAFVRILVICFLAPFMLGASQERYIVPILPLLFLHGILFWRRLIQWPIFPLRRY